MNRIATNLTPLAALLLLASASLLFVHGLDEDARYYVFDPIMLISTVIAYLMAAGVILHRTGPRMWSYLGAGMLATFTADAMLYAYLLVPRIGWDSPLVDGLGAVTRYPLWLEAVRALLFVGGPFIVVGLIAEWKVDRDTRNHRLEPRNGNGGPS